MANTEKGGRQTGVWGGRKEGEGGWEGGREEGGRGGGRMDRERERWRRDVGGGGCRAV